jgi:tetratricopeptide (TPR) repeat protein
MSDDEQDFEETGEGEDGDEGEFEDEEDDEDFENNGDLEDFDFDDAFDEAVGGNKAPEKQPPEKPTEQVVQDARLRADMTTMLKEQGNDFFRKGDYDAALRYYNSALEHEKDNALVHSNKAMCFLKLNRFQEALESANESLKFNHKNSKSWSSFFFIPLLPSLHSLTEKNVQNYHRYRRGLAFTKLNEIEKAFYDFKSDKFNLFLCVSLC